MATNYRAVESDEPFLPGAWEDDEAQEETWEQPNLTFAQRVQLWLTNAIAAPHRLRPILAGVLSILIVSIFVGLVWWGGPNDGGGQAEAPPIAENWTDIRLPHWIRPERYNVNLSVDVDKASFDGTTEMTLTISDATSFIVYHSVGLTLTSPELLSVTSSKATITRSPKRVEERQESEYSLLWFAPPVQAGTYKLRVNFTGNLSTGLSGFYRSSYVDQSGKTENMATTQFEPTDARRAFPCLDEPDLKAIFQLNITAPKEYHALSNMPYTSLIDAGNGRRRFVFDETKEMSTYLIAYIVSKFEKISSKTKKGVDVSVFTQPGKTELGRFALDTAVKVLEFYETKYQVEYPLPKMDLIAIPDFAAGAMENWGLVTYRDTALLVDEKTSSEEEKQYVAEVIAHELAHQWFGNLVTMKWWDDLWLNEGFAEFMEYKGAEAAHPGWRIEDQFVAYDLLRALDADASNFTHPIYATVHHPAEIREIFDDISYAKGSSVIRMLEAYLDVAVSPTFFFDRISQYLSGHAYANAETKELWAAFKEKNIDVASLMSTWTDQPGYPVVKIQSDNGRGHVTVQQSRFYLGASGRKANEGNSQIWQIPFNHAVFRKGADGKDVKVQTTVLKEHGPVALSLPIEERRVLLGNVGRKGVYRVQYPIETYKEVVSWLEEDIDALAPVDRAGLLNDAVALTLSSELTPIVALNLSRTLINETDVVAWRTALHDLAMLDRSLYFHPSYEKFRAYQRRLVAPIAKELGWKETSGDKGSWHVRGLLRKEVLGMAVGVGVEEEVGRCREFFEGLRKGDAGEFDPDVLQVVLSGGVKYGSKDEYNYILEKYLNATSNLDRNRYLTALGSTRDIELQYSNLRFALSGKVRKQDVVKLFALTTASSPYGSHITLTYILENWEAITTFFGKDSDWTRFNDLLNSVAGRVPFHLDVLQLKEIFVEKKGQGEFRWVPDRVEVAVRKGLERNEGWRGWIEKFGGEVGEWVGGV
ncbi:hypothetical protein HDV00_009405 [Rhizophlyctis rosea]|nr:hypothetical protein HDV00_009405 [Rhizophlyctis rosea]